MYIIDLERYIKNPENIKPLINIVTQVSENEYTPLYNFGYALSLVAIFSEYGMDHETERQISHSKICKAMKKYEEGINACSIALGTIKDDDHDKVCAIRKIYESLEEAHHKQTI